MIKFLIQLIMFGCTIFTVVHFTKKFRTKKQIIKHRAKKFSDMHGNEFSDYMDYLIEDFK